MLADEKSPTRISHRLFATSCSEMEINMTFLFTLFVTFFAGMGAGLGTGFAGVSAAAVFANRAQPKTLNRATGVVLVVLGIAVMGFQLLA